MVLAFRLEKKMKGGKNMKKQNAWVAVAVVVIVAIVAGYFGYISNVNRAVLSPDDSGGVGANDVGNGQNGDFEDICKFADDSDKLQAFAAVAREILDCTKIDDKECTRLFNELRDKLAKEADRLCELDKDNDIEAAKKWKEDFEKKCKSFGESFKVSCVPDVKTINRHHTCQAELTYVLGATSCYQKWSLSQKRWVKSCDDIEGFDGKLRRGERYILEMDSRDGYIKLEGVCSGSGNTGTSAPDATGQGE